MLLTHHFENRGHHHVQEHEGGEEYEGQIENPAHRVNRHRLVHDIGPVLKRGTAKECEHGRVQIREMPRIIFLEQNTVGFCALSIVFKQHNPN